MRILITGGAGFVGSSIATHLAAQPNVSIVALDNLRRPGSHINAARLRDRNVAFVHGDVRSTSDLEAIGAIDAIVDCAAEASVHAGYGGNPSYVVETNLLGTANCLELARRHEAAMLFLSTSRVYPIDGLRALPLAEAETRFVLPEGTCGQGWSGAGITTEFPLNGARSLYGATKLASEVLVSEYGSAFGLPVVVNRCGVLAGPWQMGTVAQGFVAYWVCCHVFRRPLTYTGYGGRGHQVRDVLHVADLASLIWLQLTSLEQLSGRVFNVGGGMENSISVAELTALCQKLARSRGLPPPLDITSEPQTKPADIPYYVTDNSELQRVISWQPKRSLMRIVSDVFEWVEDQREVLTPLYT